MMQLVFDPKIGIWTEGQEDVEKLSRNHFGSMRGGKLFLEPEEALYLMSFQNAAVFTDSKRVAFSELAAHYSKAHPRLLINYNAYRDWRDRGLVIRRMESVKPNIHAKGTKKYPSARMEPWKLDCGAVWYGKSKYSVIEDEKAGKQLFERYWLGQFGIYKQERGSLSWLDFLETIFLMKHFGLEVMDAETGKKLNHSQLMRYIVSEREYTKQLYEVYESWRLAGYVVKTGFKFGTHFRIYFPGASPAKGGEWVHSKHVLHVFPKEEKMLVSQWARIVRVAHSVKKTFILAIPKLKKADIADYPADYMAYRRKKQGKDLVRETPEDGPRYLLSAVSEDEHIGGIELASLLRKAQDMGLELILSITDRETSVTYYVMKRIEIAESDYEYYEIEWMKP